MLRLLTAKLDYFIHPSRKVDLVATYRSQLTVGILLGVVLSIPLTLVTPIRQGQFITVVIALAVVAGLTAVLVHYRAYGKHEAAVTTLLSVSTLGVVGTIAITGGIESLFVPYLLVNPVVSLALQGSRHAGRWMAVPVVVLLGVTLNDHFAWMDLGSDNIIAGPLPFVLNMLLLLAYIGGLAWFMERLSMVHREHLVDARARADDANRAKSAFLANMSHELRTPMNGVLGLTQVLLEDDTFSEAQRGHLQLIHDSGHSLVGLLNDILDLSKVEAGRLVVEDIPWTPAHRVQQIVQLHAHSARCKGIRLVLEPVDDGVPAQVMGDPTRVRQVLGNLIGNAVKFTTIGEVRVRVEVGESELRFTIQDTGPGIDPAQQESLFQPFVQADSSTARRHGGTGLGLTISRRLAHLMDGRITVDSALGEGSRFTLHLPLRPAPIALEAPVQSRRLTGGELDGLHVLVVEDVRVNQVVAMATLAQLGCTTELAEDGPTALAMLRSGRTWSVVLMDWHLPGIDGLEVTRLARLDGYEAPIVGLTASVRREDREQVLQSGMDGYLGKPYNQTDLQRVILTAMDARKAQSVA